MISMDEVRAGDVVIEPSGDRFLSIIDSGTSLILVSSDVLFQIVEALEIEPEMIDCDLIDELPKIGFRVDDT